MDQLDHSGHDTRDSNLTSMSVEELDLPNRARNCLRRANITQVADLVRQTKSQLLAMRNMGRTTVRDVNRALEAFGLRLGMTSSDILARTTVPPTPPGRGPRSGAVSAADAADLMSMGIDELHLPVRASNCLRRAEITRVADLVQKTSSDLLAIQHMGATSVGDIQRAIATLGLRLGMTSAAVSVLRNVDPPEVHDCDAFLEVMQLLNRSDVRTADVTRMTRDEVLTLPGLCADTLRVLENGLERWGLCLRPFSLKKVVDAGAEEPKDTTGLLKGSARERRAHAGNPGQPETVCEELTQAVAAVLGKARGVSVESFLAYHGIDDTRRRTLQEIGDAASDYGFARPVTRERVRQLLEATEHRLRRRSRAPASRPPFVLWQTTVEEAQRYLPTSGRSFASLFGYGGARDPERIFQMLTFCADVFGLLFPFAFRTLKGVGALVVGSDDQTQLALAEGLRDAAQGPYNDLALVAGRLGTTVESVARIVDASHQWEFLDNARQYFWKRPSLPPVNVSVTGNAILTSLCKVLSVAKRARSADLARSLPRDRMFRKGQDDGPLADLPLTVLEGVAERSGLFNVEDGEVAKRAGTEWRVVGQREIALLTICREHGRVVPSRVLYASLVRSGLTRENAASVVAYSPFLVHTHAGVGYKEGIYKFVVRPEDIDLGALNFRDDRDDRRNGRAAQETADPTDFERSSGGTHGDGHLTVAVSARTRLSGRHFARTPVGVDGKWDVRRDDGVGIGRVTISGRAISGLASVVEALGLGQDDVLEIRFHREWGFATARCRQ